MRKKSHINKIKKTKKNQTIPVFVHSHHEHQHKIKEKFGYKTPINDDHLVCF